MKRALGSCYYPEQWPEEIWPDDARRMVEAGLSWVRIGEFAWSRLEPRPDDLRFDWLDRAIDILGGAGLDRAGHAHRDTASMDARPAPRHAGSRCAGAPARFRLPPALLFSHEGYREECRRIVTLLAERYGKTPHIHAWQTDNEYGCHDTTTSYSDAAREAFRRWLTDRYGTVEALNKAWGNVFWSMEYGAFDQVGLPNLTVTEPNPAHVQAFRRFSSDQVVSFNRLQTEILRARTDRPLIHNYMGRVLDFDHYAVGADLDIATWDSYPLGFLSDRLEATPDHKARYMRQGDPDMQAFHHDLYRAVGRGRWWVMEQQPGPVNWAPWNPAPLPGMARLWAWEAFAHGAETVVYFRWRQAPFAQEQQHAGLLRPDSADAPALAEARQVARELAEMPEAGTARAPVALIFDYASDWAWRTQPQGADFDYFRLSFAFYRALRRAGLSVDVIAPIRRICRIGLWCSRPLSRRCHLNCARLWRPMTALRFRPAERCQDRGDGDFCPAAARCPGPRRDCHACGIAAAPYRRAAVRWVAFLPLVRACGGRARARDDHRRPAGGGGTGAGR